MADPKQPEYVEIFADDAEKAKIAAVKWQEAVFHLTSNGWLTPGRLAVADRYARAYAEYEALYPVAVREGPVKVGPNGGDVFNFNWSAVEKLNERLAKLEAKLKIDPADGAMERPPESPKAPADEYLED